MLTTPEQIEYAVIWSKFYDSYVVKALSDVSFAIEIKCTGTKDECAAWIAAQ